MLFLDFGSLLILMTCSISFNKPIWSCLGYQFLISIRMKLWLIMSLLRKLVRLEAEFSTLYIYIYIYHVLFGLSCAIFLLLYCLNFPLILSLPLPIFSLSSIFLLFLFLFLSTSLSQSHYCLFSMVQHQDGSASKVSGSPNSELKHLCI